MSFHKRYFGKENFFEFAESHGYENFNRWIVKPDAYISKDKFSTSFLDLYFQLEEEDKIFLYLSLRNSEEFVIDLIKCIKVCSNVKNSKEHVGPIEKYVNLFFNKWPEHYSIYKNVINKHKWKKK
jgi:hypothetical protein